MHTFLVSLLLLPSVLSKIKVERKDFFVKKGNTEVFDETVKTNPRSFDYDFADDLRHQANRNDVYDEHVGSLPDFVVYKQGQEQGVTQIPLVTREVRTWSTPAPVLDSFPYYTRSTPFRTRTTSAPFIGNVQRFIPNREPVMLEADEVKRVRELLAGGSAEVPPTSPTSNTIKTSSSTTTTTLATTTTKKLAVVQAEAPKKMEKFPTLAPTSTTSTMKIPTTTAAKPIKVKQPPHTEVKEVKKLKELPTKSPVTSKPSTGSAAATTAVPPTASSAVRTTKKFTPSKKSTTTSSPSTTSTARTTAVTVTRRASAKVLTTTLTSSVATTEPTQQERPVWRPNRPAQPQRPFKFATVMGVRREGIRTTASPRPGGIWRRGKVIFEDSTTTTTVPSTTNKPTVAYSTDRQSATHRSDEKRVKSERNRTPKKPTRFALEDQLQDSPIETRSKESTVAPKPVAIQQGSGKYKGPTFNCRVLNPFQDGVPSVNHDPSCAMSMPGLSKDGSCRCFYTISSRDENGCAEGYVYACKPLWNTSVVV